MKRRRIQLAVVVVLAPACSPSEPALETGSAGTEETESGSESGDSSDELPDVFADECDGFLQDCPAGQKCVPYGTTGEIWDATKCVVVSGEQGPGEPCTWSGYAEASDDCDQSSACYEGLCRAFCTGTSDSPTCPGDGQCLLTPVLNFCIDPCDPLADDCPEGEGCYWWQQAFTCLPRTGNGGTGEYCGVDTSCPSGHDCKEFALSDSPCESVGCCLPFCDLADPDACADLLGTACEPFAGTELGICNFP